MSFRDFQSTYDYIIQSAEIVSSSQSKSVNIAKNIAEIEIYESLDKPYLTGRLMLQDDFRFFDIINITGTEVLNLTIRQPYAQAAQITKSFVLEHLATSKKANDSTEILIFRIIEQNYFNNMLVPFSKSYNGSGENIIQEIISDQLNLNVNLPEIPSVQEPFKYLAPFITPFQACNLIRERITTENGLGYYFFATLNDENFQLKSLEEMITSDPWNKNGPFTFNQAFTASNETLTREELAFIIESFDNIKSEDSLKYISYGAFSALFETTDVVSGKTEKLQFDINEVMENLKSKNIIGQANDPVLNHEYTFKDLQMNELPSVKLSRVVSNQSYNTDFRNLFESQNLDEIKLDFINVITRAALFKSKAIMVLPGSFFITGTNNSVGKVIDVYYTNNDVEVNLNKTVSKGDMRDFSRSGKYLIHSAKHSFINTKHRVTVTGVRLDREVKS